MRTLLLISAILIFVSGAVAFELRKQKNPDLTVAKFLDLNTSFLTTPQGRKSMFVGMVSGFVFGFIDNAGLWFGMDALEPFFKRNNITGNTQAGLGNTYSDGLGAFLGTFIGIIFMDTFDVDLETTPIWANAVGVIIGCLAGIVFGRSFGGR